MLGLPGKPVNWTGYDQWGEREKMITRIHKFRRLLTLAAILGMALTFAIGAPSAAGAQVPEHCITPTATDFPITDDPTATATATEFPITSDPTATATATEFPITSDPTATATATEFPITADPTSTPTQTPFPITGSGGSSVLPGTLNFAQPGDATVEVGCPLPTEEYTVTPEPTHCNVTPTWTPEPTATWTPEPTATWTPEPTATDPIPGFTDDQTLAFAQSSCDPTPENTPVTTDLPKTGAGSDNGLQTTVILGVMAAAMLLFAAGFASNRKRNARG